MEQCSLVFYCVTERQIKHTVPLWAWSTSTPVTDGHRRMPTLFICFNYQCHYCNCTRKPVTICLIKPVPLKQVSRFTATAQLMKSGLLLRAIFGIRLLKPGTPWGNRGKHLPSDLMKECSCSIWLLLNKHCCQVLAALNTFIKKRTLRKEMQSTHFVLSLYWDLETVQEIIRF